MQSYTNTHNHTGDIGMKKSDKVIDFLRRKGGMAPRRTGTMALSNAAAGPAGAGDNNYNYEAGPGDSDVDEEDEVDETQQPAKAKGGPRHAIKKIKEEIPAVRKRKQPSNPYLHTSPTFASRKAPETATSGNPFDLLESEDVYYDIEPRHGMLRGGHMKRQSFKSAKHNK
jgi:hypothetical protein